jgi:ElaB/YqjD/DUF883 family membrane-anchored ribosome-binding protein
MGNEMVTRQGSVADSSRQLVEDLKAVAGDAGSVAREVASSATEELAAARAKVEARLGEASVAVSRQAGCAAGRRVSTSGNTRGRAWRWGWLRACLPRCY